MSTELGAITRDGNGHKIYVKTCLMCGKAFSVRGNHRYQKFCSYKCSGNYKHFTKERHGELSKCWKGGEIIDKEGYERVLLVGEGKYKRKQREIVEQNIDRKLKSNEIVHHINGDKLDNDFSNLEVMTQKEHLILHKPWTFTKGYKRKNKQKGVKYNE